MTVRGARAASTPATSQFFDGGANSSYQDQKRYKPQFYASLAYFKDGWKGSHDFKFGYDWKRDRRNLFNDQPFDIFYRDTNGAVNQVDLYNTPTSPTNDVVYNAVWISDTWKVTDRLTLNLGGRVEHYRDGWNDQEFVPNGHSMLANWNDPTYRAFVAPRDRRRAHGRRDHGLRAACRLRLRPVAATTAPS